MVELVKAGRTPEELSREFEPTAQTIHNWVKQTGLDGGVRSDGLTSSERDELRKLRRENRQLNVEREILKKTARVEIGSTSSASWKSLGPWRWGRSPHNGRRSTSLRSRCLRPGPHCSSGRVLPRPRTLNASLL